jgi:hypothetical protein
LNSAVYGWAVGTAKGVADAAAYGPTVGIVAISCSYGQAKIKLKPD